MTKKPPEITVNDMKLMFQIIDIGAVRGMFKGEELFDIGNLRNKLVECLRYHEENNEDNSTDS